MGLTIHHDTLDDALLHPGTIARQLGIDALCETCLTCPLVQVCGGGYYPHRYRPGSGFINPSVYCRDLRRILGHVHARLASDLGAARRQVSQCSTSDSARRPVATARAAG